MDSDSKFWLTMVALLGTLAFVGTGIGVSVTKHQRLQQHEMIMHGVPPLMARCVVKGYDCDLAALQAAQGD